MPLLILTYVVQIALIVHVLKTNRPYYWIFVLLFMPLVGGVVYCLVELLPELMGTRKGRQASKKLGKMVSPNKDLKQAMHQMEVADTAQNATVLAEQLLEREQYDEAAALCQQYLKGVFAHDERLLGNLAQAQFGQQAFEDCIDTLNVLKEHRPKSINQDAHLMYTRALQSLERVDEAIEEYEALLGYCSGPETACRYALLLKDQGDLDKANKLFDDVLHKSRVAGKHYQQQYKSWIQLAKKERSA